MKIIVNCWDEESFNSMVNMGVEKIRIGINNLSIRFNNFFKISDLEKLCSLKKNSKISVSLNKFFSECDIDNLTASIIEICKFDIDEISFGDLAICQIIFENNIKVKMHYNPEMILTNYEQIYFFQENNINRFMISNVLMEHEINEIISKKNKSELELQVFGHTLFMFSIWPLISNFNEYLISKGESLPEKKYYLIQEESRDVPSYIYEDESGTHMYSGFILNLSKKINKFKSLELDYIFIETIFKSNEWTKNAILIFKDLINCKILVEDAYHKLELMDQDLVNSESFVGNLKNLPCYQKEKKNG